LSQNKNGLLQIFIFVKHSKTDFQLTHKDDNF